MSSNIGSKSPQPIPESINQGNAEDILWIKVGENNYRGTKTVTIKLEDNKEYSYKITLSNISNEDDGKKLFNDHIVKVMATAYSHGITPGSKKSLEYTPETNKFTKTKLGKTDAETKTYEFKPINRKEQKELYTKLSKDNSLKEKCIRNTLDKNDIQKIDSHANEYINLDRAVIEMNKLKTSKMWADKIVSIEHKIKIDDNLLKILKKSPVQSSPPANAIPADDKSAPAPVPPTAPASVPPPAPANANLANPNPQANPTPLVPVHASIHIDPLLFSSPGVPTFSIEPDNTNLNDDESRCIKKINESKTVNDFYTNLEQLKDKKSQIKVLGYFIKNPGSHSNTLKELARREKEQVINALEKKDESEVEKISTTLFPDFKITVSQRSIFSKFFSKNGSKKDKYISFLKDKKLLDILKALLQTSDSENFADIAPNFLNHIKVNQKEEKKSSLPDTSPKIPKNDVNAVKTDPMSLERAEILTEVLARIEYIDDKGKQLVRDIINNNELIENQIKNAHLSSQEVILILGALTERGLYSFIKGKEEEIEKILQKYIINSNYIRYLKNSDIENKFKLNYLGGFHALFKEYRKGKISYGIFKIFEINAGYVPVFQKLIDANDNDNLSSIINEILENYHLDLVSTFFNSPDYQNLSDPKKSKIKTLYSSLLERNMNNQKIRVSSNEAELIKDIIIEKHDIGSKIKALNLKLKLKFLLILSNKEMFDLLTPENKQNIHNNFNYYGEQARNSIDYIAGLDLSNIIPEYSMEDSFIDHKNLLLNIYNKDPHLLGYYLINGALKDNIPPITIFEKTLYNYDRLVYQNFNYLYKKLPTVQETKEKDSTIGNLKAILEKNKPIGDFLEDSNIPVRIKKNIIYILEKERISDYDQNDTINAYRKKYITDNIRDNIDLLNKIPDRNFNRFINEIKNKTNIEMSNVYNDYLNNKDNQYSVLDENTRKGDARKYILQQLVKTNNELVLAIIFDELAL